MGNFIPGLGIVGGALKMSSSLLNPSPTLADLKRSQKEIQESLIGSTGIVKTCLEQKLEELKEEMKAPNPEIIDNFKLIKEEVQSSASIIAVDMRRIEGNLADVKSIIDHTYQLVRDSRYRDGIEKIDVAFRTYFKGSNNLDKTFSQLESYIYELMVLAEQNLGTQRICEYLQAIRITEDISVCQHTFKYILIVRARYLQMFCAYYIFNHDVERVTSEFQSFNRDYEGLCGIFEMEMGCKFEPDLVPSLDLVKKCQNAKKVMPDITQAVALGSATSEDPVEKFLNKIGLSHLYELFKEEEVTMELLANFKEMNLINVGVKKYGNRLQILNGIKALNTSGMLT